MANRFAIEGADVMLAGRMSSALKDTIRSGITLTGDKQHQDGSEKDDIHLILEYKRQEQWGRYVSPRANRYTYKYNYSRFINTFDLELLLY